MILTDETTIKNARQRLKEIDKQSPSEMSEETLAEISHLQHIVFLGDLRGISTSFSKLQKPADKILETLDNFNKEFEHLNETTEEIT